MNWEKVKSELEGTLNTPLSWARIGLADWPGNQESMDRGHQIFFRIREEKGSIQALSTDHNLLTPSERRLVEMVLSACRKENHTSWDVSEEDRYIASLRDWVSDQLDSGVMQQELPESFASQSALYSAKIPLLLYGDPASSDHAAYRELKKLLDSFFEAEMVLIPLMNKEWLILGAEDVIQASAGEDAGWNGSESAEESLESICSGLYEMMVNEWIGECHLAVDYPMIPAKSLLPTILRLREAISLGRKYHLGTNIHFPWKLHLEKLVNTLPESDKRRFLESLLKPNDLALDSETVYTLEHFFALNCNVSETAKKLYIHRNTLLYRLDKFKQETGLDVRLFDDAVLVKIALLLYKVTKRK